MFDNLKSRLNKTIRNLRGQGRLSEENIKATLKEVRVALLDADVALPVVTKFLGQVKDKALGTEVLESLKPGDMMIKIVKDELTKLLGHKHSELNLKARPPVVILVAGLQGAGKTTSVGKLARWLKESKKKSVLVTSTDIYRPAAIDQLETLAEQIGVSFYPSRTDQDPKLIADNAIDQARKSLTDVVIIDTAGRLHVDDDMMKEIKDLHKATNPVETLFVIDSMLGQDAANSAAAFAEALPLTGTILTKVDGDARGGAALSAVHMTEKPIKFMGTGEKTEALESFHPERIASRILGMGDLESLFEKAEKQIDKDKAKKLTSKLKSGQGFNYEDFRDQMAQMRKMGGMKDILGKLPNMPNLPSAATNQFGDNMLKQTDAIIGSMTPVERRNPQLLQNSTSRLKRIAGGAGVTPKDVKNLIRQFSQMQKMMKKFKGGKMKNMMGMLGSKLGGGMTKLPGMPSMAGGMPSQKNKKKKKKKRK